MLTQEKTSTLTWVITFVIIALFVYATKYSKVCVEKESWTIGDDMFGASGYTCLKYKRIKNW